MLLHSSSVIIRRYDDIAMSVKFDRKHRLAEVIVDL